MDFSAVALHLKSDMTGPDNGAIELIDVDLRIARVRAEIAAGHGSEIAHVELTEFLNRRKALVEMMALEPVEFKKFGEGCRRGHDAVVVRDMEGE